MPTPHRVARPAGAAALALLVIIGLTGCVGAPAAVPTPKPTVVDDLDTGQEPTATPTGAPVEEPVLDDPAGSVAVYDDTRHVVVSVPDSWDDVDGAGFVDGSGRDWYEVAASPDLEAWSTTWQTPGVQVAATALPADVDAEWAESEASQLYDMLADGLQYDDSCEPTKVREPYEDSVYTGVFSAWRGCGGTETSAVLLTVWDADLTHVLFVNMALVSDDDKGDTLAQIINTFQASFA